MTPGGPLPIADDKASAPFLVLPENRFAQSALLELNAPASHEATSVIYLYGPSGTGKSHLIQSVLAEFTAAHPDGIVLSLTASEFSARYTEAAEGKNFRAFRRQFQQLDILAIEDLQGLARKVEAQRQLVTTLDDALAHGCRLIITCRTQVAEIPDLMPELVSRCHGAVTVAIRLPSTGSRERLLQHWAKQMGLELNTDIVQFLAEKFAVSPRELLGVLTQLKSIAPRQQPLTVDLVRRHLLGQHPQRTYELAEIAKCVARQFQVTLADLRSKSRQPRLVLPRQCAIYLLRELTDLSLSKIGDYFGGRDHSTILHACDKFALMLPDQPDLRQHLSKIRTHLELPQ